MSVEEQDPRGSKAREEKTDSATSTDPAPTSDQNGRSEPETPETASYYEDPYEDYDYQKDDPEKSKAVVKTESGGSAPPPPPPTTDLDDADDDEEGMARMSFLEHLEELRTRIIRAVLGMIVAYLTCLAFAPQLFKIVIGPFENNPVKFQYDPPLTLTQITPFEQFHLMYIKIPLLAAIFLGSPWLMYQAWAFIAPGLYKRERRWAGPFVFSTAGLFILGGAFCYFVALRLALGFLLGIADEPGVRPMIQITSYFDMFFNLHVGLGVVFQMPIVIFFFTLLRITSPGFLLENVRYAVLIIFIIAAIITPTPDVTTMLTFAAPMILLFYVGIGASYLIVFKREKRRLPWIKLALVMAVLLALLAGAIAYLHLAMDWQFAPDFPWFRGPSV